MKLCPAFIIVCASNSYQQSNKAVHLVGLSRTSRYVFGSIGLFVCFVCLLSTLLKKLQMDCNGILWRSSGYT